MQQCDNMAGVGAEVASAPNAPTNGRGMDGCGGDFLTSLTEVAHRIPMAFSFLGFAGVHWLRDAALLD